ncbi:hypothetical protein HYH02_012667 [Chlamydomonas schloesseri]|uniref:ADP-ribosylglycohydrolase n=1 Tax=Chlamydomonas schloesseri TaxID=2026947 RepID=A0A835T8J8_9CHLO|nr:hypothetical protein HYH02_012667 [Chlamydomonas schloesseri]|eukprot:KAG2433550.1 hypothetical protein HYH02_012667 [Chlamydomonas schloesseri]
MPDTELELAAQRVRQLEAEAMEMHDRAQRFNKEGKFAEAQAAYAAMHKLEDEASALAAKVGCVACVLGDDAAQKDAEPSLCNLDPNTLLPYQRLHRALPWRQQQEQQPVEHQPSAALLQSRAVAAAVGSSLADAAAMGVHWVYDLATMEQYEAERRVAAGEQHHEASSSGATSNLHSSGRGHPYTYGCEFMEPPRSPFYAYASGRNSPYGEQTLVLLRSLAESGGLDCGHYADTFEATFGLTSGFDGYRDVSTKGFLRNYARAMPPPLSGANDAQANAIARLAPLVAAFALGDQASGASEGGAENEQPMGLLKCVELATRVTQNTDAAVAWACAGARVLELVLAGWRAEAAVREVVADLRSPQGQLVPYCSGPLAAELADHLAKAHELRGVSVPEATAVLGRNCHMPNALQTPLQVVMHVEHLVEQQRQSQGQEAPAADGGVGAGTATPGAQLPAEAYVWGVRLAVREGGCCASRAAYVGACLGAMVAGAGTQDAAGAGAGALPADWLAKYTSGSQVKVWAEAIMAARSD